MLNIWDKIKQSLSAVHLTYWLIYYVLAWSLSLLGKKINHPFLRFFSENLSIVFALISVSIFLYIILKPLGKLLFKDDFKGNLNTNWEFHGGWTIQNNQLNVTDSEGGGITRVGANWENYDFKFKTRIMNTCSGWIIRAENMNNYFMFQCRHDVIVPHQRVTIPRLNKFAENDIRITMLEPGWYRFDDKKTPHYKDLGGRWFDVVIKVRGSGIEIYIDNDLVFSNHKLITIPMGKVGFRNYGSEHALFKKVRVYLVE